MSDYLSHTCEPDGKEENSVIYTRSHHKEQDELYEHIHEKYNVRSLFYNSGIHAIYSVLDYLFSKATKKIVVATEELYCDTHRVLSTLCSKYKLNLVYTSCANLEKNLTENENNIAVIYTEILSNPNGYMCDLDLVKNYRKRHNDTRIVIDNTWLTLDNFNPCSYMDCITVESMSKYYSQGHCIFGAAYVNTKKMWSKLCWQRCIKGIHVSPYNCKKVLEGCRKLPDHLDQLSNNIKRVMSYLDENKIEFNHPFSLSHPTFPLIQKYAPNSRYPAVINIKNSLPKEEFIEKSKKMA